MSAGGRIPVFGTYEQERIYILYNLDEFKHELASLRASAAVQREGVIAKAQNDLNALHKKIRALELRRTELTLRYWITTAALSAAVAVIFELGRILFARI
jgi:hypothetical protein